LNRDALSADRDGRRFDAKASRAAQRFRLVSFLALAPAFVSGCLTLTAEPRALLQNDDGSVVVQSIRCGGEVARAAQAHAASNAGLDPQAIRLVTWNLHKQQDAGWQRDLTRFAVDRDIVLLQEIVLDPPLRGVIADAGLRWVMASSFLYEARDIGVLTAARTAPLATCTQRVVEPLLRLPKSAVITWFALRDRSETLAVVNVHAVNFALSLGAYRAQFDAIVDALAEHRGPLVLAGDLNTWTDARSAVVKAAADRLGLAEIAFDDDRRRVFFGHQLDRIYVRGLEWGAASATPVTSSDHNPVAATLRVAH
jgi:endonuclease/exonuclease/phosphatase (EEP) superfamily protein YafD